jgi:hypothetical protein
MQPHWPLLAWAKVSPARVVHDLSVDVLRLGYFGSRQCTRSWDRCGCRGGDSRTLCLESCPFLLGRKCHRLVWCAVMCCVCGVSILASACSLWTGVDVGAAAPELFFLECRPFLLGQQYRRIVWCAALGPVCSVGLNSFL